MNLIEMVYKRISDIVINEPTTEGNKDDKLKRIKNLINNANKEIENNEKDLDDAIEGIAEEFLTKEEVKKFGFCVKNEVKK